MPYSNALRHECKHTTMRSVLDTLSTEPLDLTARPFAAPCSALLFILSAETRATARQRHRAPRCVDNDVLVLFIFGPARWSVASVRLPAALSQRAACRHFPRRCDAVGGFAIGRWYSRSLVLSSSGSRSIAAGVRGSSVRRESFHLLQVRGRQAAADCQGARVLLQVPATGCPRDGEHVRALCACSPPALTVCPGQ